MRIVRINGKRYIVRGSGKKAACLKCALFSDGCCFDISCFDFGENKRCYYIRDTFLNRLKTWLKL